MRQFVLKYALQAGLHKRLIAYPGIGMTSQSSCQNGMCRQEDIQLNCYDFIWLNSRDYCIKRTKNNSLDVDKFRKNTAKKAATRISDRLGISTEKLEEVENILSEEINSNSPDLGIKSIIDSQKKKILISQTYKDKDLADIVYNMLVFNNVPTEDIIYTNCDNEISRIPEGDVGKSGIYDYLRDFFVDSYSTQKMYVIFVTSKNTKESWGALTEVGAAWITQIEHKIFNIHDFRPEHPLDDEQQWHTSFRDEDGNLYMSKLSADIFSQKIEYICDKLGYRKRTRQENTDHLETLVKITPR